MVDKELYYEKNQLLIDTEGEIWVLLDIIESKSILSKHSKLSVAAYIKKKETVTGEKEKIVKMSFRKFSNTFSPFRSRDKETINKVLALEKLLDSSSSHPLEPLD